MIETLTTLFDEANGDDVPLPEALARWYGALRMPATASRRVLANFVTTLDGVVSWNVPGQEAGGEISGHSDEDTALMGLLRAVSDAVIIGAATLKVVPDHLWTPEYIQPHLKAEYIALRRVLGKAQPPLAVVVTGSGNVNPSLRVFTSGEEPALIVSTREGALRLRATGASTGLDIIGLTPGVNGKLSAVDIVRAVESRLPQSPRRLLVEGGPLLMGSFFEGRMLDELFLTVAPQVAGRDPGLGAAGWRPGLVEGALLAPDAPAWGRLVSARRHAHHLFLRYQFAPDEV